MSPKSGLIPFIIAALFAIFLVAVLALFTFFHKTSPSQAPVAKNEATSVVPKAEYENPFDQKTQSKNPFNDYNNPFDNLK